ncbi:kinase-like protein, partial [Calocera viscosa TUFC12733]
LQRLRNELMTWTRLKHPNILEFYGVCEHAPYWLGLVSPWMAFGDVKQYLQACPEARRSELLLDIAHGLAYMHSLDPPIVHGSVMLQNVLVKPTGEACIAGFAMSGVLRDSMEDLMNFDLYPGNPRLMAPEVMSPEEYGMTYLECYTPASDVYSFGMVAYELYSDRLPFDDIPSRYNVFLKVKAGGRPLHPGEKAAERGLRGGMWDIVQDCWRSRPEERPIARELVRRVAAVTGLDAESRPK